MIPRWCAVALGLAVSAPAWSETSHQYVSAARAAEKRGQWRKALKQWQAAYRLEINAEYLISIGDAHARLGNKAEARKQYEAYLTDPLALPANAATVKAKLAALDGPAPGAIVLDLPPAKTTEVALALPELTAPSAKTPAAPAPLPLPGLDVPALPTAASAQPAVAKPLPSPETRKVPIDALLATEAPRPTARSGSGAQRVVAWVAAGVAVAALSGGALAYTKANSAQSDLTSKVRSGAAAQQLLEDEKRNKTLSFVGFAGGLVAAGLAVALFTF
jgi:tetratricopeptide (TPR) repeat protein